MSPLPLVVVAAVKVLGVVTRLMTMSPLYPCGKPCSRGTHNETVKNPALSPAFDHDSIDRIRTERLP